MARLSLVLPLLVALPFALAGCDDSPNVAALDAQVGSLQSSVKKLEGDREKLASRLDAAERKISGLQEDLMQVHRAAESATATAGEAQQAAKGVVDAVASGAASKANPQLAQAAHELGSILSTDEGRQVFEGAIKAYEARRDEERSNRMVSGLVDAFAQKANLSSQQKEQMAKIVNKSFAEIGGLWRSMRDQDMTPEERAAKRTDSMAKMEEIRKRTDDEVKTVLDASQWDMYQQETARMRGFMGGGGGMGGGFGGPGGRGQ